MLPLKQAIENYIFLLVASVAVGIPKRHVDTLYCTENIGGLDDSAIELFVLRTIADAQWATPGREGPGGWN
jgi:hypothetical protein